MPIQIRTFQYLLNSPKSHKKCDFFFFLVINQNAIIIFPVFHLPLREFLSLLPQEQEKYLLVLRPYLSCQLLCSFIQKSILLVFTPSGLTALGSPSDRNCDPQLNHSSCSQFAHRSAVALQILKILLCSGLRAHFLKTSYVIESSILYEAKPCLRLRLKSFSKVRSQYSS